MKNDLRFVLLVAVLSLAAAGRAHAQPSSLEGRWTVDFDASVALLTEGQRAEYDTLSEESVGGIKKFLTGQAYTFNADSTFVSASGAYSYEGKWSLSNNVLLLSYYGGADIGHPIRFSPGSGAVLTLIPDTDLPVLFKEVAIKKVD